LPALEAGQGQSTTHTIQLANQEEAVKLLGRHGEFRKCLQAETRVRIVDRGAKIVILGDDPQAAPIGGRPAAETVGCLLEEMLVAVRHGHTPTMTDLTYALGEARDHGDADDGGQGVAGLGALLTDESPTLRNDLHVNPRTRGQQRYLDAIRSNPLTLVIGPAGTGKTYLAMAAAVSALLNKAVSRLILARPAVEAGERLGFLPGDLEQKVNPYLRPLHDALYSMVDVDRARGLIEREKIEVAPLAFMRGRTLDQAFVILDEAQNTTAEQMMMFLTRLGEGSRAVVTGDITQIDLPKGTTSGLVQAKQILRGIAGIAIINLTKRDVVRHPLVQRIVDAYEADVRSQKARGATAFPGVHVRKGTQG